MPMDKTAKTEMIDWIGSVFDDNEVVVVFENAGLTVSEVSTLRTEMREAGGGVKVVKNSLVKIALKGRAGEKIEGLFNGPTVLAFSGDPVTAPKVLTKFAKANDNVAILGGIMGDIELDVAGVKQLAAMPSREEILSSIAGLLGAPASNIVSAFTAPGAAIAAITETLENRENA